jgi:hypothetical protein
MNRFASLFVVVLAAGCGGPQMHVDSSVRVSAAPPPSPSTWPDYPTFSAHSCWARSVSGSVLRAAPSIPVHSVAHPASPPRLAQLLGRIAWVESVNPGRGARLRERFALIDWAA